MLLVTSFICMPDGCQQNTLLCKRFFLQPHMPKPHIENVILKSEHINQGIQAGYTPPQTSPFHLVVTVYFNRTEKCIWS